MKKLPDLLVYLYCLLAESLAELVMERRNVTNIHFREMGYVAGATGMGHLALVVDTMKHLNFVKQLCALAEQAQNQLNLTHNLRNTVNDMWDHCQTKKEAMMERRTIWINNFGDPSDFRKNEKKARRKRRRRSTHPKRRLNDWEMVTWCEGWPRFQCESQTHRRVKRQFIVGALLLMALAVAVSNLFSPGDLHDLVQDQKVNVRIMQTHQTRLAINQRSITLLNSSEVALNKLVGKIHHEQVLLEYVLNMAVNMQGGYEEVDRVIDGMSLLSIHRLSPGLVKTTELMHQLTKLRGSMATEGYQLGITTYEELYRCETSHLVYTNGTLVIVVHIPAFRIENRMQLLHHLPVPTVLREATGSAEAITITPKTDEQYLAVTGNNANYKTFSDHDLLQCSNMGGTYFCPNDNVLSREVQTSCLMSLYLRHSEGIKQSCTWTLEKQDNFAIQISEEWFLLYLKEEADVKLMCREEFVIDRAMGVFQVRVPSGCFFYSEKFTMVGQQVFAVKATIYQEKHVDVKRLLAQGTDVVETELGQMIDDLGLVGSSKGLKIPNLKDEYATHLHLFRWNWGIRSAVTTIGIILICMCTAYCILKYRKIKGKKSVEPTVSFKVHADERPSSVSSTSWKRQKQSERAERSMVASLQAFEADVEDAYYSEEEAMAMLPLDKALAKAEAEAEGTSNKPVKYRSEEYLAFLRKYRDPKAIPPTPDSKRASVRSKTESMNVNTSQTSK